MELPSTKDFQWKSLAPLPSRRVYSTLVEAAGQVFAVGGCDDNGVPVDSFEVYSPEADQWAALPPMPTARAGVAVTALGKRIMVIGGVGTNQLPLKVVEMYNTDEGRWRKRSSLREAAMGISVTAKGKEGPAGAARGGGGDRGFRDLVDELAIWVWLAEPGGFSQPLRSGTKTLRATAQGGFVCLQNVSCASRSWAWCVCHLPPSRDVPQEAGSADRATPAFVTSPGGSAAPWGCFGQLQAPGAQIQLSCGFAADSAP